MIGIAVIAVDLRSMAQGDRCSEELALALLNCRDTDHLRNRQISFQRNAIESSTYSTSLILHLRMIRARRKDSQKCGTTHLHPIHFPRDHLQFRPSQFQLVLFSEYRAD